MAGVASLLLLVSPLTLKTAETETGLEESSPPEHHEDLAVFKNATTFVRETSVNHLCKHCVCVCGSGPSSHAGGSSLITAVSLLTSRTDRLLWRLRLVGLAALALCLGKALGGEGEGEGGCSF